MAVRFDRDHGELQLGHAALSLLARLAVDPTDPTLRDHAVAEPLAQLRRAGVIGPGGIDQAVAPLAAAVGAARTTLELRVGDRRGQRRHRGWVTGDLVVFAVAAPVAEAEVYDLVADRPETVGGLVAELTGLAAGPAPTTAPITVEAAAFDALVARGGEVDDAGLERVAGAAGRSLAAVVEGLVTQWRLSAARDGRATGFLEVLDAGDAGLWVADPVAGGRLRLTPVTAGAVQARVRDLALAGVQGV